MSLQPLFRRFHEAIQLTQARELTELIQKSDRIFKRLRDNLAISFQPFYQGSYAIGTGVKPINRDYDIDVGIVFNLDPRTKDPVEVKGWVHQAVAEHTARVEWRHPCITVYYQQAREVIHHVDLAILTKDPRSGAMYLAWGKQHAPADQRQWQLDDRKGFIDAVDRKFTGEDAAQFRRVIRYLKRWKDIHFPSEGRSAPSGHALTVAAYYWFQPVKTRGFQHVEYDDLGATLSLVRSMQQSFGARLALRSPIAPQDDVFARMSDEQMKQFRQRLEKLSGRLEEARRNPLPALLQDAFGKDFPST